MKKNLKVSLVAASLALIAGTASAGITSTPHNLTSTGPGPNKQSNTEQICVFCHTPHASNTSVTAPLWNKGTPAASSYTTYSTANSSTIDGKVLSVGSVSAACLSCHDGTQAMDNLVNAPGSGGLNTAGSNRNYTWTGSNKVTGVANLTQDLTNDHPIGIQYCGGGVTGSGTTVTANCADKDFKTPSTNTINNVQVFWIDTTVGAAAADTVRTKTDIILYSRKNSLTEGPLVECASCHDPHTAKADNGADVNFMRVTTSGSKICLACHTK